MQNKLSNIVLSGCLAALGGVLGKYSGSFSAANFSVPVICFLAMIICNSTSWSLYVKALQNQSALVATISCSAVNFILSGMFGALLFSEPTGTYWSSGIALVIIGLCISLSTEEKQKSD